MTPSEGIFMLVVAVGVIVGIAWIFSHIGNALNKGGLQRVGTNTIVRKPLHISLVGYFVAVVVVSVAVLFLFGDFGLLIVIAFVLPVAVIGLLPVAIINKRYHRILNEQTGNTTGKTTNIFYTVLYWLGLAVLGFFTSNMFLTGILSALWQEVIAVAVLALIYHGIISLVRK